MNPESERYVSCTGCGATGDILRPSTMDGWIYADGWDPTCPSCTDDLIERGAVSMADAMEVRI